MRDRETIDSELRRIALGRRSVREQGGQSSSREVDELLDELLAHSAGAPRTDAVTTGEVVFVPDAWSRGDKAGTTPRRRPGALRRFGFLAALPLSLVALAAAVVVIFAVYHQDSSKHSAEAQPTQTPPSAAPPKPVAPKAPAPRIDMADVALITALKQEGVPVPSQEYVMAQGHAVCDFLAHQPNFADAVGFVQRSTIWDPIKAPASPQVPSSRTALSLNRQPRTRCSRRIRTLFPICRRSKGNCKASKTICTVSREVWTGPGPSRKPSH